MQTKSTVVQILLLLLIITLNVYGQGALSGIVTDSVSNEKLYGASLIVVGTALGDATNIEGEYQINNIPKGKYNLKISYIGYKTKNVQIDIEPDDYIKLDVTLVPDVIYGATVEITAQALGQAAAINQQRTSNTIINVVSEEKIKELPDANAAESVGRLPGVSILRSGGEANKVILRGLGDQFTNITIDGVKIPPTDATSRGVDLSTISQSSLAGIELYKALTPDKDGDALAGSVNLVTKKAPEKRLLRLDTKGDYNNLMKSAKQYDFALRYGERFFDNLLGLQVTGNLENRIRSNERINENYNQSINFGNDYFINDFLLEFTDEVRKRNGFSVIMDFDTPDEGSIKFTNVYGGTTRDYLWHSRDYPSNGGGSQQGAPAFDYRDRKQEINTFSSSLHGNNNLFNFSFNWGLSYSQSVSEYPFDYELIFVESSGMNPSPMFRTGPEQLIPYAINNFQNSILNWAYYRSQRNFDKEKTAFLDITRQYILGSSLSGEFKFGGKYKMKNRSNGRSEQFTPYYLGNWKPYELLPDGTFKQKDFSGTYFEDYLKAGGGHVGLNYFLDNSVQTRNVYDTYLLNPLINKDKLKQWWDLNRYGIDVTKNVYEVWDNPMIKYDNYYTTERVASGYLMNTLNIEQYITIIVGARIEREDNDYRAAYMTDRAQGFPPIALIRDTTSSSGQTVILPNLNISFRPYEFMNIRLAAYKAIARPDFNMRLDRYIAGRPAEVSGNFEVYVGNPNLKTAQAWNFEINTSFYGNEIGLISLSAYYKEIKDMYHMLNNFNTSAIKDSKGVYQDTLIQLFGINWPSKMGSTAYNLTLPYNSPKPTKVWGFEFEHQINFTFLPGLLKNIVLSYNASIVRSEAFIYASKIDSVYYDPPGPIPPTWKKFTTLTEKKETLEGMPEFFGNISLGYDIGGFSGRISLFHKGEHNISFSASGLSDRVNTKFTRIDISLKQKVTDFLALTMNINNITNVEDASSIFNRTFDRKLFDQSEKYGLAVDFGAILEL
jgi:TonB-dependent receptor